MNNRITAAILLAITAIAIPTAASAQTFVPGLGQGGGNESSLPTSQLEYNRQKANDGAFVGSIAGGAAGLLASYLTYSAGCVWNEPTYNDYDYYGSTEYQQYRDTCNRATLVAIGAPVAMASGGGLIGRNLVRGGQDLNAEYRPVWEGLGIGLGVGVMALAALPQDSSDPILPILLVGTAAAGGAVIGFLNPLEGNAENFSLAPTFDHEGRMGLSLSGRF